MTLTDPTPTQRRRHVGALIFAGAVLAVLALLLLVFRTATRNLAEGGGL